jgi:NAD(P)-dependent dehydrogenase (short-subunit alcohol dehydrogenase family)
MELRGKVAVVTGAASGVGFGLAERFGQEGMKVVLADIEQPALAEAEQALKDRGAEVLAVKTDVAKEEQVRALAEASLAAFGAVHVVCNNAGVVVAASLDTMTANDWRWMLDVNLGGVINGIRVFVPILVEQDDGYVINTSSIAGLATSAWGGYSVTKHAIVAASEALYHSLASRGSNVKVSVLCTGWVRSRVMDAGRNRQPEYLDPQPRVLTEAQAEYVMALGEAIANGIEPSEVADQVVRAMAEARFYILTHPETMPLVHSRFDDILQGRQPTGLGG